MVASRGGRSEHDKPTAKRAAPRPAEVASTLQLVFTIDGSTGQVVKLERLTKTGSRSEVTAQECAELMGEDDLDNLESAVDEAYEAGIADGLDEDDADDEEVALQELLTHPTAEQERFRRGVRRVLLRRLLMRRLIRRRTSKTAAPEGAAVLSNATAVTSGARSADGCCPRRHHRTRRHRRRSSAAWAAPR